MVIKDILHYRLENTPDKIFIQYENQEISYKKFNYLVNNIMKTSQCITVDSPYIGIQIQNKLKLLILIIALNRSGKIPVIYPDYPNIKDYIKSTGTPIHFKDDDIIINPSVCKNDKIISYNSNDTQLVIFSSGTTGVPKPCELTFNNLFL